MKLALNLSLFLLTFTIGDKSLSLSDFQIKKICREVKRESHCIKNMQEKRSNLHNGNKIEIPVIPYKDK